MSDIEQMLRQYEDMAKTTTDNLTKGKSFGGMLVLILTVGCLTGFGEEVFFRGMFTRLIIDKPCNKHIAIWIGAFLFSLMHFQFYGFDAPPTLERSGSEHRVGRFPPSPLRVRGSG